MTLNNTVPKETYAHMCYPMLSAANLGKNNENQLPKVLNVSPINHNT